MTSRGGIHRCCQITRMVCICSVLLLLCFCTLPVLHPSSHLVDWWGLQQTITWYGTLFIFNSKWLKWLSYGFAINYESYSVEKIHHYYVSLCTRSRKRDIPVFSKVWKHSIWHWRHDNYMHHCLLIIPHWSLEGDIAIRIVSIRLSVYPSISCDFSQTTSLIFFILGMMIDPYLRMLSVICHFFKMANLCLFLRQD